MSDVIIGATLQVDAGSSNAVVKELNQNTTELKTNLKDVGTTAVKTGEDIKSTTGNFGKLKDGMTSLPGPLGQAGEGVNKLNTAFKSLLANPVGLIILAIVAALALLYKAFTNTFEGGQKMEQIFAGIKAAGQALFDSLGKIASSIVKIFSFDFSGAIEDMKEVGEAAVDAYNKMADLTKQAQDLHQEQLKNDLEGAERAKKLALLREQASDDSVPIAERKKALQELKADAEQNAKDDIELAKKVTENKIAQLTLEKDGYLKNRDEINKLRIDQINTETENANELRRINKQVTAADKQEIAERNAAAKEAAAAAKERREKGEAQAKENAQKLAEFNKKLTELQQSNELAQIKDGYARQLRELEIKIANEKKINEKAQKENKITKKQQAELDAAAELQNALAVDAVKESHNKEINAKEEAFQKELAGIKQKTMLSGITDTRQLEMVQLEIGYNEKLQQAITRYKDDQTKFFEVKAALDEQFKQEQDKIKEKNAKEDAKKALNKGVGENDAIIKDPKADFDAKNAAIEAEQALVQKAFDDKVISEEDYNTRVATLADQRKTIRDAEAEQTQRIAEGIGNALETLANIAGKQTVAGKVLAIASTTIKTIQGGIAAFTGMVSQIPGPVGIALGAVAAAGVVASGVAAVKKIVSVQIPGQGNSGGGASANIAVPAAPIAPTQQGTTIDQNSINGIGDATSGRVYVLDSDVQNSQEKATRLNRAARLGG